MRHLKAGKRLGVTTSHRKALMRNLVTALLEHGKIVTTLTKAKEMRKDFDKMITLAKKQDLHSRRQILSFVKSKEAVEKLYQEYVSFYKERNGGYTQIFRLKNRQGDNAKMAVIQMLHVNEVQKDTSNDFDKETLKIDELKEELQLSTSEKTEDTKNTISEKSEDIEKTEDIKDTTQENTDTKDHSDQNKDIQ